MQNITRKKDKTMRELKIKGMLLGAIAGDAIGTPFNGLSKTHIHAVYKSINNYTDATPALKGKLQDWKKAALYSSSSQLMLLLLIFTIKNKRMNVYDFARFVRKIPEAGENEYGIFRHPGSTERHFMQTVKEEIESSEEKKYYIASARSSVIIIPFSVLNSEINDNLIIDMLSFSFMFNKDVHSAAGALLFVMFLKRIIIEKNFDSAKLLNKAIEVSNFLLEKTEVFTNRISEIGIMHNHLESCIKDYLNIFFLIKDAKEISEAEKIIVNYVNTKIKTPVTRATIDHPLAIIPFAVFFTACHIGQPSEMLFRAAEIGGTASILCALTGALTGAMLGTGWLQGNLLDNLVNKKRIINIVDSAINAKITDALVDDFIRCEASLTVKEIQEKNAKLKHVKIKPKKTKKKSRKDIERELSAHVVESWTKLDKAKWRKKIGRGKESEQ